MKTIELDFMPNDRCWVRGQYRECIIEDVIISSDGITYNWYNLDIGVDTTEVWDDGCFKQDEIGLCVFKSLEEYEKAFPEDFAFPEQL